MSAYRSIYPTHYGDSTSWMGESLRAHMQGQQTILAEMQSATRRGDHRAAESARRALNYYDNQYCCMWYFAFGIIGVGLIIDGAGVMSSGEDTGEIVVGSIFAAIGFFVVCFYCLNGYYGR